MSTVTDVTSILKQQEDLLSLGKLFLSLACRSLSAIHNIQQSLDMGVARTYSSDFSNALLYLLSKPNPARKSIDEFWSIIAGHVDDELRGSFDHSDLLEGELARELENGRLFRLMAKFGFINERPE
jgi:PAB-dependent poly(A)-specific ribonuclease subunit 3